MSVLRPLSLKLVSRRRKLVVGLRATRIFVRMRAIASEVPLGTVAVVTEPELLNVVFSRALTNFQVPLMLGAIVVATDAELTSICVLGSALL